MKRRSVVTNISPENWLIAQWTEAVQTLQTRPASRRGQMVISDEALENFLEIVASDSEQESPNRHSSPVALLA